MAVSGEVVYSVPVVVAIEDGEIVSVRVYDESITGGEVEAGVDYGTAHKLLAIATDDEWPAWEIG